MPGRSIPEESADREGPTCFQVPSNTPPRRLLRTRRSESTLRLGHSSAALEPPVLPPTPCSFHQLPSHPSRSRSPAADSRLQAWRNEIEASPTPAPATPATETSQDQNPSPAATAGPWESISRDGTPPLDHPNRDPRRICYIISDVPCICFKCTPPRTDEEHRVQLENAKIYLDIMEGNAQHFKRLLEGSDEDLKTAFNGFANWLAMMIQVQIYIACLRRSRHSKDDVWEQLRQISARARAWTSNDRMVDWSISPDCVTTIRDKAVSKPSDTQNNS